MKDTWVLNLNTNAFSRYDNYYFNSMMRVGDKCFGGNEDGLFDLSTKTENSDVLAKILTGYIELGGGIRVNVPEVYINGSIDGSMLVTVTGSDEQSYTYSSDNLERNDFNKKVLMGRGRKQTYYQFEISNGQNTDEFKLNSFRIVPIIGTKF